MKRRDGAGDLDMDQSEPGIPTKVREVPIWSDLRIISRFHLGKRASSCRGVPEEALMPKSIIQLNIERFRRLLSETTDVVRRGTLQKLLAEEEDKKVHSDRTARGKDGSAAGRQS
jgi:hypothetical protein